MKLPAALPALVVLLLAPAAARAGLVPNHLSTYGIGEITVPRSVAIGADGTIYVINAGAWRIELYTKKGTHVGGWGSHGSGPGQFEQPYGLTVAPWGDVYVTDVVLHRVQRFNQAGVLLGSWGTSGSGPGEFNTPYAITIDPAGTLYVADTYNHRVQKFSATGTYLGQWGVEGAGPGQLKIPQGIVADAAGNIYVADTYNHRIQKFSASGAFLAQWGSNGTGDGQFAFPYTLAIDAGGNLYVDDINNHRIQRFTTTGVFVAKWGSQGNGVGQFQAPQGIAIAADGRIHVSDTNHRVQVFTTAEFTGHETIGAWGSDGSGNGEFSLPFGIAVAPDGFVYVVDYVLNRVQKFTYFGAWANAWGSTGSGPGQFQTASGVAVDPSGTIYVTDYGNARVQKFDAAGTYLGQWGTAGTGAGQFNGLGDIAADAYGNVYVVDANRVQRFTTTGVYVNGWTAIGAYGVGVDLEGYVYVACPGQHLVRKYHPTGTLVTEWGSYGTGPGQFDNVADVAADSTGDIYVCDYNRIQRFTPRGAYLQEWGSPGAAMRQLGAPQRIAADAAGNLYVTEANNHRVQKFGSPPVILRVEDVPGDQGGAVKIRFRRTSAETEAPGMFTQYDVHRNDGLIWTHVGSVPVGGGVDSVIVPTSANATPTSSGMAEFRVWVVLAFPGAYVPWGTLHGYSVDNLPPPTPSPFTAAYSGGTTFLHWQPGGAYSDLSEYRVYRDVTSTFEPGPGNQIAAVTDTFFNDVGPPGLYYRIVAVDVNGNVSPSALLGPGQTVSTPDLGGLAFGLQAIRSPVPARDLVIAGALATALPARVELFDIGGRRVWSHALRAAGRFQMTPGRERPLAPGVYAVRLSQGERVSRGRVVVLE
jgi:sugar lactone lactonase YvrE